MPRPKLLLFLLLLAYGFAFDGCGGTTSDEGGSGPTYPPRVLSWQPPTSYSDGTPLDPRADLAGFEIYVKESAVFAESDNEMAAVSATNPATGQVNTSFDLANLGPYLSAGVMYHVSVRAVADSGLKSAFSSSASFSF